QIGRYADLYCPLALYSIKPPGDFFASKARAFGLTAAVAIYVSFLDWFLCQPTFNEHFELLYVMELKANLHFHDVIIFSALIITIRILSHLLWSLLLEAVLLATPLQELGSGLLTLSRPSLDSSFSLAPTHISEKRTLLTYMRPPWKLRWGDAFSLVLFPLFFTLFSCDGSDAGNAYVDLSITLRDLLQQPSVATSGTSSPLINQHSGSNFREKLKRRFANGKAWCRRSPSVLSSAGKSSFDEETYVLLKDVDSSDSAPPLPPMLLSRTYGMEPPRGLHQRT
ncbi:unnamed protein product, partial [Dibothriocephalus latus]